MNDLFPTLGGAGRGLLASLGRALRCLGRGLRKLTRPALYLVAVLLVIHIVATLITGHMLQKQLAALKDAGEPMSLPALAPKVPRGEENAAAVYQQAFDALRLSATDKREGKYLDDLAAAREVVHINGEYFDLLDRASEIRACRFPVNWEDVFAMTFPHLPQLRDAQRMLRARARVLTADGDYNGALAVCGTMFRVAEHVKMEPALIGQVLTYALQRIAVEALEESIQNGAPNSAACRRLLEQLAEVEQERPFLDAMRAERAMGIWSFDYVRRHGSGKLIDSMSGMALAADGTSPEGAPSSLWRTLADLSKAAALRSYPNVGRPLLNLDEMSYLQAMTEYIQAARLPWPETRDRFRAVDREVQRLPMYRGLITRMAFPVFDRARLSGDHATAYLGAAQVALALKAYRAERGSYPESLEELTEAGWKLPSDPFGGALYRYRRDGDGFVVWSIGPDVDDDGAELDWRDSRQLSPDEDNYDLVFRCER